MSVLGYERIMQLLTGNDEYRFEHHMLAVSRHGLSPLRLSALKELAKSERATVSALLKGLRENSTGGTYLSITSYFRLLEKERILAQERVGRRTYWRFSKECEEFRRFLLTV